MMSDDNSHPKKDIGWNHGYLANPSDKNSVTCKYCQKETKGGIFRLKQHLVGGFRNVVGCNKCPQHVKEEVRGFMEKKKVEKDQTNLIPDFDDAGLGDDYDEDEIVEIDGKGKRTLSAGNNKNKKVRQVGPMDSYVQHKVATQSKGKEIQTTINDAYKKELRNKACADIARWMYEAAIPFTAVKFDSFKSAVQSIGRYGLGMKPPSYHEVRVPLLKKEVCNTNDSMKNHKEEWARTGCSILSDGWTDRNQRTLVNFLVNCFRGSMFIESIDASNYVKTGDMLFKLLSQWIEKIGAANVVQVVTDNGSNYVLAGHGGSDGLHAYVHSLDAAVADLKSFLDKVLAENPRLPCFCFGHSTGAAIVLKAVLDPKVEARVAGIVLTSPAVGVQPSHPIFVVLAPVFSLLLPRFQISAANKKGMPVSRDPEALVAKYSDPLVYTGSIRVRTGYEILRITTYLQQNTNRLRVPFLVLHGTADTVTDPAASAKLYEEASSTDKTIKLFEGFLHDLLFEPEKEDIMNDIIEWLNCRV